MSETAIVKAKVHRAGNSFASSYSMMRAKKPSSFVRGPVEGNLEGEKRLCIQSVPDFVIEFKTVLVTKEPVTSSQAAFMCNGRQ